MASKGEDELRAQVLAVVAAETGVDITRVSLQVTLKEAGIASLDLISILFAVEDRFGIQFQDNYQDFGLQSLQDLLDEVSRMVAAKQRAAGSA